MRAGVLLMGCLTALSACGPAESAADAGALPTVRSDHSLFWADAALLEDPKVISFAKVMATVAPDGHGGRLLERWFQRFATTAHSERALPAQFVEALAQAQGADPSRWDLGVLPFKVTGVHNRIDLADLSPGGHCGELRVSVASTDPTLQPFHLLFLFRQAAQPDDVDPRGTHCAGTARRWVELSALEGPALRSALIQRWALGFTRASFLLAESVEFTLAPWEWRQWVKAPDPTRALPFVFENPPLFQQVDLEKLNPGGAAAR